MTVYQWLSILGVQTLMTSIIGLVFGAINSKMQKSTAKKLETLNDQVILKEAMVNIIRDMLYRMYVKAEENDSVTFEEQENFIQLHESYSKLGGNSYVHEIKDKFLQKRVK